MGRVKAEGWSSAGGAGTLANLSPQLQHWLPMRVVGADQVLQFAFGPNAFVDPDGEPLVYSATGEDGASLPSWLVFDPATRTFTSDPGVEDVGETRVVITATDPSGATDTGKFWLRVISGRVMAGTGGDDDLAGTPGEDSIRGGNGDDQLQGGAGFDTLVGGEGLDTLVGGEDSDYYYVTAGDAVVEAQDGGNGDAVITAGSWSLGENQERIYYVGTARAVLGGNGLDNWIIAFDSGSPGAHIKAFGLEGRDLLLGTQGADELNGGPGRDSLNGKEGPDLIRGGTGGDNISGESGDDLLYGGRDRDTLSGGEGADTLYGGADSDHYFIDSLDVLIEEEGAGIDTVRVDASWTLGANLENLELAYGEGADGFRGTGNSLWNSITGSQGPDTLDGGRGRDHLGGGGGSDVFVFANLKGADWIADFAHGVDVLQLSARVFTAFAPGEAVTETQFVAGAGQRDALTAEHRLVYDTEAGRLYYDEDGTGSAAPVLVAILSGDPRPALAAGDFTITT